MKAGIWYEVDEKIPPKTGYYLAFKGMSMGDDELDTGYYYWNAKTAEWRENSLSISNRANIVYWTEADPDGWYEKYDLRTRSEITEAEKDAWAAVEHALEQYEIVRQLARKS
jgi:hypothetical protein